MKRTQGFTFIELAIVAAIVGLLIGSAMFAQNLIHDGEMKAVMAESVRYQEAVLHFKQQYKALPGDMKNATSFWGVVAGNGHDEQCRKTPSLDAKTCDGDGFGTIWNSPGSFEQLRFWQHLANAKLIGGHYAGVSSLGSESFIQIPDVGAVVPASEFSGAAWSVHPGYLLTAPYFFRADYGKKHLLIVGGASQAAAAASWKPVFSPLDAKFIDAKLDDGLPGTGKIIAMPWNADCTNARGANDLKAVYNPSSAGHKCALAFVAGF